MNEKDGSETDVLPVADHHVLVLVDDEVGVLRALERMLKHEPYEVRTTAKPIEALEWVRQGNVSVVMSDQRMPVMQGTELLRRILGLSPRTVCALLTGFPSGDLTQEAEGLGIRSLIEKPWNDEDLKRTIRHLFREQELLNRH